MLTSEARIATDKAGRYMAQLCKHFSHKIPATHAVDRGRIEFPAGTCLIEAGPDVLVLRTEAQSEEGRVRVEEMVGSHLERFMWREAPEITWR